MDGVRSVFPARGRIYRYTCGLASESGSGIAPGDTLTLLPGVYRQGTVAIRCRGTQESPIVIQGKDRENTLVTAWKSLDTVTWEPVPGKPFVYRAAWAEDTYGISDLANKRNMMPAPGADDMERFRGTYFYDRKEHYLYCHSFTGCKPGNCPERIPL